MTSKKNTHSQDMVKKWEERAKNVYKETLQFMRDGFHGLEVIAEKTMEVTRIRLSNQQAVHRMKVLFADLGQRVYEVVDRQRKNPPKLPPDVYQFVEQIKRFQNNIEENIRRLRHLTTVTKASHAPQKPSRKAARRKTGATTSKKRKAK